MDTEFLDNIYELPSMQEKRSRSLKCAGNGSEEFILGKECSPAAMPSRHPHTILKENFT